jgi:hypothetical protein
VTACRDTPVSLARHKQQGRCSLAFSGQCNSSTVDGIVYNKRNVSLGVRRDENRDEWSLHLKV